MKRENYVAVNNESSSNIFAPPQLLLLLPRYCDVLIYIFFLCKNYNKIERKAEKLLDCLRCAILLSNGVVNVGHGFDFDVAFLFVVVMREFFPKGLFVLGNLLKFNWNGNSPNKL